MLLLSHFVYFLGGALTFLATDFWTISACRFMVGISHHTVSHLPYLLGESLKGMQGMKAINWIFYCKLDEIPSI